ncbi:hypothetical protein [Streptomyces sp. SudanB182_2057]|uniref:hypothetical protein n=1 Tax=Streptomyces sp. SudanB182_2057 TaxID=3035281 RepID=UPI003F5565C4
MTDTFRTLIGDLADDAKKAFDDILDRPSAASASSGADLLTRQLRLQAVANLPAESLQLLGKLAALQSLGEEEAARLLRGEPLSDVTGLASRLGTAGGAAGAPLAGLSGLLAGASGAAGAAGSAVDLATALSGLPGQVAQLQETLTSLTKALESLQNLSAAAGQSGGQATGGTQSGGGAQAGGSGGGTAKKAP